MLFFDGLIINFPRNLRRVCPRKSRPSWIRKQSPLFHKSTPQPFLEDLTVHRNILHEPIVIDPIEAGMNVCIKDPHGRMDIAQRVKALLNCISFYFPWGFLSGVGALPCILFDEATRHHPSFLPEYSIIHHRFPEIDSRSSRTFVASNSFDSKHLG